MARLIVTEKRYSQLQKLFEAGKVISLSGIYIKDKDAEDLIAKFSESDNIYPMAFTEFDAFKKDMMKVKDGTRRIGIGVRFGRIDGKPRLNMALEPISYERIDDNKPIDKYRRLDDASFFGRVSTDNFVKNYDSQERDDFYDIVFTPHSTGVLLALIPLEILKEFAGGTATFNKVWFQFGLNANDNLTVFLSKRNDAGGKVASKVKGITGIYLDDHDLIPPPDKES